MTEAATSNDVIAALITKAYLESEPRDFGGDVPPALHLVPQLAYR